MPRRPSAQKNKILTKNPEVPGSLSPVAAEHWEWITPKLVDERILCSVDLPVIEMACRFWDDFVSSGDDINRAKKASDQYIKIMKTFGVTYESRERMKLADNNRKNSEKLDDDMFGGIF